MGIAMIHGNPVPLRGFVTVFRHAGTVLITLAKIRGGSAMSRIGGLSIPPHGFRPVLCHTETICVVQAEDRLRRDVSSISRGTEMRHGRAHIPGDASSERIHVADAELLLWACSAAMAGYFSAGRLANIEIFVRLRPQGWRASQKQNHCD